MRAQGLSSIQGLGQILAIVRCHKNSCRHSRASAADNTSPPWLERAGALATFGAVIRSSPFTFTAIRPTPRTTRKKKAEIDLARECFLYTFIGVECVTTFEPRGA